MLRAEAGHSAKCREWQWHRMDHRCWAQPSSFAGRTERSRKMLSAAKMAALPLGTWPLVFMKRPRRHTDMPIHMLHSSTSRRARASARDLELQGGSGQDSQTVPATASTSTGASTAKRGFFTRLGHAYLDDWTVDSNGAPTPPAPERRGTPPPLNSPPFPRRIGQLGGQW